MHDGVSGQPAVEIRGVCERGALMDFDWRPGRDWEVTTAGEDGRVKTWDVRRSGTRKFVTEFLGEGEGGGNAEGREDAFAPNDTRPSREAGRASR